MNRSGASQEASGRPRWKARLARALGLDGNPLRRASDRAEAWIRAGLLVVFLAAGPIAALAVGQLGESANAAVLASAATLAVTALALLIALRLHSAVSGQAPPGCVGGGLAGDWTTMDGPQVVTAPQRAGFHDATDYAVAPGAWYRPFA